MENPSQRHELIRREPIFHHPDLIWDASSFDDQIANDFNEVGASGRRYSRSEVKEMRGSFGCMARASPLPSRALRAPLPI